MVATAEMTSNEKAILSREINRAIEIKQQIEELTSQLKYVNNKIYGLVEGEEGLYRSNRGHLELKISQVLTIPEKKQTQLAEVLGERYPDLVEETLKLGAKSGLRRLIFEPGPHETDLSESLKNIVSIQKRPSFTYKGA